MFRTTGYSVAFDPSFTGQDFDGDGQPEVVFWTDAGGGTQCCFAYNVVSLSPAPRKLFDIDANFDVQFDKDAQGRMVIWRQTAWESGFMSNSSRPSAEQVSRVLHGKLVDATPEFCPRILTGATKGYRVQDTVLTTANLNRFRSAASVGRDDEEIASALLSRALQRVLCHRFDDALDDLNLWPGASRAEMKAEFAGWIKVDYPEFAARLDSARISIK